MNFCLNASDFIIPIAIVYIVGVVQWPKCVLPKSVTSHENEGYYIIIVRFPMGLNFISITFLLQDG